VTNIDVWLGAHPQRHVTDVYRGRGHTTLALLDEHGLRYQGAGRDFDAALAAALARFEHDQDEAREAVERDDAAFLARRSA